MEKNPLHFLFTDSFMVIEVIIFFILRGFKCIKYSFEWNANNCMILIYFMYT